jgi:hypothetical protein
LAGEIARAGHEEAGGGWSTYAFVRVGPRPALWSDADTYRSNLANYRKHFERQGLATSDEVVDATCIVSGDVPRLLDRLQEYTSVGLGTPCLYPVGMSVDEIESLFDAISHRLEVAK